jgi:hypothetical protein
VTTPDKDIKKIKIDHSDLLAISKNNKYYLRYRIVYEDGSQESAWSTKYIVDGRSVERVTLGDEISTPTIKSDDVYITCDWNIPASLKNRKFDVMVRWSYTEPVGTMSEWFYDSTVSSGTANIVIPSKVLVPGNPAVKAKYVQVLVQLETVPKAVSDNNSAVLFQTDITTTKSILDGGTP